MEILCLLNGKWSGRYQSPDGATIEFTGNVPGCAHTDLWREGIIRDPYFECQSEESQFIEKCIFEYETDFTFDGDTTGVRIAFDRLDTYCDIWLNGSHLGFCNNMFIKWDFDVEHILKKGENHLLIRFYPPAEQVKDMPECPAAFTSERIWIRRMQCTFSWDWVERFVTMGVEGNVTLYRHSETEIDSIYIATTALDDYGAEVRLDLQFSQVGEGARIIWFIDSPTGETVWKQARAVAETQIVECVSVKNPMLWWPNGYGEQPIYTLKIQVYNEEGKMLEERSSTFGIRTIRVVEHVDPEGSDNWKISKALQAIPHIAEVDRNEEYTGFQILVNGKPVYCRGGDWVPSEPFLSDVRREKVEEILRLAAQGNMNMVRVWGGGVIESDDFYDICDRLGILVCQDFLMACGVYPEDREEFLNELRKEEEEGIMRIRNHPSLAWWIGDNENSATGNIEMHEYPGRRAATLVAVPILKRLDPYRRFFPSSPSGGKDFGSSTCGTAHGTMQLGYFVGRVKDGDLTDYQHILGSQLSRFNTEVPVFGAPAISSLKRFISDENLYNEDVLEFHTKNNPSGILEKFPLYKMQRTFAEKFYGDFKDGEDRLLKMRALQYEWVRYMVELYRRNREYTGGILFWMLNDCWPANSWSLIDYHMNPKGGWYAIKQASRPVMGSIYNEGDSHCCKIVSEADDERKGVAHIALWDVQGECPIQENTIPYVISGTKKEVIIPIQWDIAATRQVFVLTLFDEEENQIYRTVYFPSRIVDLELLSTVEKDLVEVKEQGEDYITVYANKYAQTVNLDGDYVFEDNFFTMLSGETKTVRFRPIFEAESKDIRLYVL